MWLRARLSHRRPGFEARCRREKSLWRHVGGGGVLPFVLGGGEKTGHISAYP